MTRPLNYKVALIVPVFNEQENIEHFVTQVKKILESELEHLHVVFVDDGSKDNSAAIINKLIEQEPNLISLIALSRNFGKEAAMSAAIDLINADAYIPIDVDMQDPIELILDFIKYWRDDGYDSVCGERVDRSQDSGLKRASSGGFYYIFNKLSLRIKIPENVGDFRLMDKKVVKAVRSLSEGNRFMKALYAWPGFSMKLVPYQRPKRFAGTTKWNYWRLWNFALDGIVGFSSLPLRVWSYIGTLVGVVAFIYMIYILTTTLLFGSDVPGYASLMCVVLFLGAVQLVSIGVLGEYIGRISQEVKKRPVYIVNKITGKLQDDYNRENVVGIVADDKQDKHNT